MFDEKEVFEKFDTWLREMTGEERPRFVSDNPAFDWQWINDSFHRTLGRNPFGYSARRIGDFYAGLVGDFTDASSWKRLRITKHDHHPVHDAMGNLEAFYRLLKCDTIPIMKTIAQFKVFKDKNAYIAEGIDLAIVTEAKTLDSLVKNIYEAVSLYFDKEMVYNNLTKI